MAAPVGNQNAAKAKIWSDAVRRALITDDPRLQRKRLDVLAEKLVEMAMQGDISAIKEVGDRVEGKPAQSITGEDGGPIVIAGIQVQLVRPGDPQS